MTVALIGAGPGDPGLLTRRGAELLGRADVVIYDRLIGRQLLELAPADAELIDVGKLPGEADRQSAINAQLIEHGRSGRRVVRLKGGDPFVFGRGGEEAEALRVAGVGYEVVPGVSSAFAAPAAAGIPVTHRGLATSVSVVTGHLGGSSPLGVDWDALGRSGGTLVILMGMSERARIAEALMASGRGADTPVAVVHWGTTDGTTGGPFDPCRPGLHRAADARGDRGRRGGRARPRLDRWLRGIRMTVDSPLAGRSVVVTRSRAQASSLVDRLTGLGATVVELPVIAIGDPADGGAALSRRGGPSCPTGPTSGWRSPLPMPPPVSSPRSTAGPYRPRCAGRRWVRSPPARSTTRDSHRRWCRRCRCPRRWPRSFRRSPRGLPVYRRGRSEDCAHRPVPTGGDGAWCAGRRAEGQRVGGRRGDRVPHGGR